MALEYRFEEMTDEQVVSVAQGHQGSSTDAALEYLLNKYKNFVRTKARSYFLIGADHEDIVQEGMIGLYLAITDFKEGGVSFKNFAYLCIRRRMMSAVRQANRKKHSPLNESVSLAEGEAERGPAFDNPEDFLIMHEDGEELMEALRGALTENEYGALLSYMEGLSIAEIAAKRGVTVKSADNAVQRAKKKARSLIDEKSAMRRK